MWLVKSLKAILRCRRLQQQIQPSHNINITIESFVNAEVFCLAPPQRR